MNNSILSLEKAYEEAKIAIKSELRSRDFLKKKVGDKKSELDRLNHRHKLLEKVDTLYKMTSDYSREQSKTQIEDIVSHCLSIVFEAQTKFEIKLKESYKKTSAEFYVTEEIDGVKYYFRPENSRGGGMVDIVSLALRIAFLLKYEPAIEGPLILDEPAKHVSDDYIFNVADFLKQVSEEFDRQVILITHNDHLAAIGNQSYRITMAEGQSRLEDISS